MSTDEQPRHGETDRNRADRLEQEVNTFLDYLGISLTDWRLAKDAPDRIKRALWLSRGLQRERPKGKG